MSSIQRLFTNVTVGMNRVAKNVYQTSRRRLYVGQHFTRASLAEIELKTPVPLAGRESMASSKSIGFPKFLRGPRENFPMLVKAHQDHGKVGLVEWAKRARELIDVAYQRYEEEGTAVAILFRGLPITTMKEYSTWVNALGFEPFKYVGGVASRNEVEFNVAEGALDFNEYTIELHSDMAYMPKHPKILSMFCMQKAAWGGETAICDAREILASLDSAFVGKCAQKSICYTHFLNDKSDPYVFYKSWQEQFLTEDPKEVEAFLIENGYTFEWKGGNPFRSLCYWHNMPALRSHPITGELLWFNSAAVNHHTFFTNLAGKKIPEDEHFMNTMYGDKERFSEEEVDHMRCAAWQNAVGFDWQNGDVLLVDQMIVNHSRLGFEGNRQVGISLLTY